MRREDCTLRALGLEASWKHPAALKCKLFDLRGAHWWGVFAIRQVRTAYSVLKLAEIRAKVEKRRKRRELLQ